MGGGWGSGMGVGGSGSGRVVVGKVVVGKVVGWGTGMGAGWGTGCFFGCSGNGTGEGSGCSRALSCLSRQRQARWASTSCWFVEGAYPTFAGSQRRISSATCCVHVQATSRR